MANNPEFKRKLVALVREALSLDGTGNRQQALMLIDQAITFSENSGLPAFDLKVMRENLAVGNPPDLSKIITVLKEGVAYYRHNGDILRQIDMLLNLSAVVSSRPEKLQYLDEIDHLISSITEAELEEISKRPLLRNTSVSNLLSLRSDEVKRRKQSIHAQAQLDFAHGWLKMRQNKQSLT